MGEGRPTASGRCWRNGSLSWQTAWTGRRPRKRRSICRRRWPTAPVCCGTPALGEARAQAARELAGDREKLDADRKQLQAERAQVQEEGRVLEATRAALEEGMRLAQEQAKELRAVLEDRTHKLSQADARVRSLTSALEEAQAATAAAHASARRQLGEQSARHDEERRREADRAASTERHLMSELDRARQDAKAAREETRKSQELHAVEARGAADHFKELLTRHDEQARALAEAKELLLRSEAALQQAREAERQSHAKATGSSAGKALRSWADTLYSLSEVARARPQPAIRPEATTRETRIPLTRRNLPLGGPRQLSLERDYFSWSARFSQLALNWKRLARVGRGLEVQ